MINKLKEIFYKLLSKFRIEDEANNCSDTPNNFISNADLLNNFTELFLFNLKRDSVRERMLYPMYFNILMNEKDYEDRKVHFPYIVPEIISALYDIIKKESESYTNFKPVCKYWVFQFTPCRDGGNFYSEDGEQNHITQGSVIPTALLYNPELDIENNISIKGNIRVSVKCNNSNVIKNANINLDALLGIDILDEGYFRYKFSDKLVFEPTATKEKVKEEIVNNGNSGLELAKLTYQKKGLYIDYIMKSTPIYISGKHDNRKISTIFQLENEELENGHVQIKYENEKFYLCTFGVTRLNERDVPISKPGDLHWIDLADNSSILMNSFVTVRFRKLL